MITGFEQFALRNLRREPLPQGHTLWEALKLTSRQDPGHVNREHGRSTKKLLRDTLVTQLHPLKIESNNGYIPADFKFSSGKRSRIPGRRQSAANRSCLQMLFRH
jgi:hypothetical protein